MSVWAKVREGVVRALSGGDVGFVLEECGMGGMESRESELAVYVCKERGDGGKEERNGYPRTDFARRSSKVWHVLMHDVVSYSSCRSSWESWLVAMAMVVVDA